ncbi:AzlC family ABC transporter permease [Streptomyces sp. TRM68367]|uniref:AzlC family ABC transporter permease n=1 Tax=Streptomyces sp. TRM68367 TaxID=2758415 RepID=UPI00165C63F0|nr:AzlC family ABC transporter permease [Streptomyces sp. TRM68367]MBC9726529.1 AzlC family ABC transporter permease [Streptomyces sp. TRM68367]
MASEEHDRLTLKERRQLLRDALGVGLAVGAYGLSYGALAVSSGLSVGQTQFLSLLLYGGSAQLALVGALAAGAGGLAASATATLLGVRSVFYGVSLRPLLKLRGKALLPAAHLLSDESTAMAIAKPTPSASRYAYWVTGSVVFLCWNVTTLIGALAGSLLADPKALGLDAASSAAFLALVAPRLRDRAGQLVFVLASVVAIAVSPFLGSGLPVLIAGLMALSVSLLPPDGDRRRDNRSAHGSASDSEPLDGGLPDSPPDDEPSGRSGSAVHGGTS